MSTSTRKLKRLREQGIKQRAAIVETTEVCASFSRKFSLKNYGGPEYESIDFFASLKLVCPARMVDMARSALYEECINEVEFTARQYMLEAKARGWKSKAPPPPTTGLGNAREFEEWQKKRKGVA